MNFGTNDTYNIERHFLLQFLKCYNILTSDLVATHCRDHTRSDYLFI